jgi:hypothetical protein
MQVGDPMSVNPMIIELFAWQRPKSARYLRNWMRHRSRARNHLMNSDTALDRLKTYFTGEVLMWMRRSFRLRISVRGHARGHLGLHRGLRRHAVD